MPEKPSESGRSTSPCAQIVERHRPLPSLPAVVCVMRWVSGGVSTWPARLFFRVAGSGERSRAYETRECGSTR